MKFAVAVAALLAAAVAAPMGAAADGPVDDSRRAAGELRFSGDVRVQWVDDNGAHTRELAVEGGNGVIVVRGPNPLMVRKDERYLKSAAGWALVWPAQLHTDAPGIEEKYDVAYEQGPAVAGRATRVALVRLRGVLRERLYVDAANGLILRREQIDPAGGIRRLVTFDRLTTSSPPTPSKPRVVENRTPKPVGAGGPSKPYRAPATLQGGYQRVGAYRWHGRLQVLYSDGVYGLSVFEERGRVNGDRVPRGSRAVRVGSSEGWHVAWPGGEIVLWQAGEAVFTVVGDAPLADIITAAGSMPGAGGPSTVDKLRRACRSFLRLFS